MSFLLICRRRFTTSSCYFRGGGYYNPANPNPRESFFHKGHVTPQTTDIPDDKGCVLCKNGLDKFGYKDVLLLRQFLTPEGYLMNKRVTGICNKMQQKIAASVRRSRKIGLIPKIDETNSKQTDTPAPAS